MLFGRKAKNEHYLVVLEPIHRWQGPRRKEKVDCRSYVQKRFYPKVPAGGLLFS